MALAAVYRVTMSEAKAAPTGCHTIGMAGREPKRAAFEQEALPHASSLLRAALSIVRNGGAAEDLVQDTLLRAWRFFDRFDQGTNCKAWLFRIMLNLSSEVRRKRAAEASTMAPLLETHAADRRFADADVLERDLVRRAFEALPDDQRTVLHLAIVDGFTCKEISELLAVPMGTVMSRLSRGRAALRRQLAGRRGEGSGSDGV